MQQPFRTGSQTGAALLALAPVVKDLREHVLRLGVAAPETGERTPLEKYRGTYPRAIVQTEMLDIEYGCCQAHDRLLLTEMQKTREYRTVPDTPFYAVWL